MDIIAILEQYGFATVAAIAMGWFIWFIYTFITQEITSKLGEANKAFPLVPETARSLLDNWGAQLSPRYRQALTQGGAQ